LNCPACLRNWPGHFENQVEGDIVITGYTSDVIHPWRVESAGGSHRYRFTNLVDHTAWQVVLHHQGGNSISIPGPVSYARGSFEETLRPGQYRLTWQITPSMLSPREGDSARPEQHSATFSVPLEAVSMMEIPEGA